ncbi:hypothetical protein GCM10011371_09250 [Novosphingobium marinum]|uniref:Uncharacterized protein n=1 Tax=Novosphingobium marinum TaxID=1514948 RepID=A0A7Y9XWI6_9SPHN|nr:hypothetical protein [Novosphingobium marinum]NYH94613.1 hypothetical protein [Novosphingobium marinum]GGC23687.1 hypothetical protein GCM10011371_09250 [Novosphingobium marinum]
MAKRDNAYWAGRLEKDGLTDTLEKVRSGKITMYQARQQAGYLKRPSGSPAKALAYHWQRASADERRLFVLKHAKEVNRVVLEVFDILKAEKAKKDSK